MNPKQLSISDFTYELPPDRIANYPLPDRDASKLLVYTNGEIQEDIYRNISQYMPEDSLLILNNTRVVEARLLFRKPTGGVIEIFCLEPHAQYADITTAMSQRKKVWWHCLIGGASKWKPGQVLEKPIDGGTLQARYLEKLSDTFIIELSWQPEELSFAELLHRAGVMPLPPYIKRNAESSDAERYQTIYARAEGSVAAPTAGLHFTDRVFAAMDEKNIQRTQVTLHVSAGTFKPVKSETMAGHEMHAEFFEVNMESIQQMLNYLHKHITVTGTTSLRTVESLYWLGVKILLQPDLPEEQWTVHQWDAYELEKENVPVQNALQALMEKLRQVGTDRVIARTHLLIAPGYTFKIPRALVTNLHQPQSTLLLLVAAWVGEDWRKIYRYALDNDFRFLSYGDGCLLFRN
jgi:S-adenosylmethionine:tRNA ribosyltransferase-isomerase